MTALKSAEDLGALIGDIYDAATDKTRWAGLMQRLTSALSGTAGVMISYGDLPADGALAASHNIDPDFQSLYEQYYHKHDILAARAVEKGWYRAGVTTPCDAYIDRGELERSTYYNEFLKKTGCGGLLHTVVLDHTTLAGAPSTTISVIRPPESPLFDARALELAKLLAPHLQRALLIHWRLTFAEVRAQTSEAVLDRLEHGIMQLSAEARVLYANHAASQALGAGRALCLERGVLATRTPGYASRLRTMLHQARNGVGGLLHIPAPDGTPGTLIIAVPLPLESAMKWHPRTRVLVLLSSAQDHASTRAGLLARTHGLTPAETRVLELLATDRSPAQIADTLGTRITTVRSQLKSIYMKTGVQGQRELLVVVSRMPPLADADALRERSSGSQ